MKPNHLIIIFFKLSLISLQNLIFNQSVNKLSNLFQPPILLQLLSVFLKEVLKIVIGPQNQFQCIALCYFAKDHFFCGQLVSGIKMEFAGMEMPFYCIYFGLFIDQMAESEQKQKYLPETGEKQHDGSEENAEQSFLQQYVADDVDSEDLDLESTYLNRLRIQRKRIEELSLSLSISREKYEEEVARCKTLEMQLEKYQSGKVTSSKIEEIHIQMESVQQENERFKTQVQELKRNLFDVSSEWNAKLQKMASDNNAQRKKDAAKIENLQEQLAEKEDQIERLEKDLKTKERQYNELNNQTSAKINKFKDEYEERIKVEQRKLEKTQQEKLMKSNTTQDLENQLSLILKENEKLKEENFKLGKFIEDRERELLNQVEKYKSKLNSLKKELKLKEKDYDDLKSSYTKFQKEKRSQATEKEQMRVQITKITEQYQTTIARKENDFFIEKRNLKATIEEQGKAIGQLMSIKTSLIARIRELEFILKRKEDMAKQRKSLLKDELREIDKLEKVIDRIVE